MNILRCAITCWITKTVVRRWRRWSSDVGLSYEQDAQALGRVHRIRRFGRTSKGQGKKMDKSRLYAGLGRFVLACVVFSLLVSGCIGVTPGPEPVAIKFMFLEVDRAYYEALLPRFEERYPHIAVELDAKSYRQWRPHERLDGADVIAAGDWVLNILCIGQLDFEHFRLRLVA